jgi:hypothetical protein
MAEPGRIWALTVSTFDFVHTAQHMEQGRFARSIEADHANLRAVEIGEVDVFEDGLLVVVLADADHGIDNFVWFSGHVFELKLDREGSR